MSVDKILRGHDLFRSLPVEDIDAISRFAGVKDVGAGATIFTVNQLATHLFMLMEGEVNLMLPSEPALYSIVVSLVERGELFGLSPLLGSERYTLEARSTRGAAVLAIEVAPFLELLERRPVVGFHTMRQAAQAYYHRHIDVLRSLQGVVRQIPLSR